MFGPAGYETMGVKIEGNITRNIPEAACPELETVKVMRVVEFTATCLEM